MMKISLRLLLLTGMMWFHLGSVNAATTWEGAIWVVDKTVLVSLWKPQTTDSTVFLLFRNGPNGSVLSEYNRSRKQQFENLLSVGSSIPVDLHSFCQQACQVAAGQSTAVEGIPLKRLDGDPELKWCDLRALAGIRNTEPCGAVSLDQAKQLLTPEWGRFTVLNSSDQELLRAVRTAVLGAVTTQIEAPTNAMAPTEEVEMNKGSVFPWMWVLLGLLAVLVLGGLAVSTVSRRRHTNTPGSGMDGMPSDSSDSDYGGPEMGGYDASKVASASGTFNRPTFTPVAPEPRAATEPVLESPRPPQAPQPRPDAHVQNSVLHEILTGDEESSRAHMRLRPTANMVEPPTAQSASQAPPQVGESPPPAHLDQLLSRVDALESRQESLVRDLMRSYEEIVQTRIRAMIGAMVPEAGTPIPQGDHQGAWQKAQQDEDQRSAWYRSMVDALGQPDWRGRAEASIAFCRECLRRHEEQARDLSNQQVFRGLPLTPSDSAESFEAKMRGRLLPFLLDPVSTLAREMMLEIDEFVPQLYSGLQETEGAARSQVECVALLMRLQDVEWIVPPAGVIADDRDHLIVGTESGKGPVSTVATLIKPGYVIRRDGLIQAKVLAHVTVNQ
jgi:hypothetical protein